MIADRKLAEEVVARLNGLIAQPEVKADIQRLLEQRIPVSQETADHPTLQVGAADDGQARLGPLGLLNGIVGAIARGSHQGSGHLAACFDDNGHLQAFALVESPETESS